MIQTSPWTAVIVTHNSRRWIDACLQSLPQSRQGQLVVVDSGSTDGTPQHVQASFPHVKVIEQGNLGYGAACNRGAREASHPTLVFLNPDLRLAGDAVDQLVHHATPGAIATPQVLLMDDPGRVNTRGLSLHFTGIASVIGFRQPREPSGPARPVQGFSGACFAMRRDDFMTLGGFDENIFLYGEDTELSWRAAAMGMEVLYVPSAIVWHAYTFRLDPTKLRRLEQSRRYIVERHWSRLDRLLLAPSRAVARLLAFGAALSMGRAGWREWQAIKVPEAVPSGLPFPGPRRLAWAFRVPGAPPLARAAAALATAVFWLNGALVLPWRGRRAS